jgi:oligopeptidase B
VFVPVSSTNTSRSVFVTAGLYDSQVGYHEPAKWVARLRASKTDNSELLFITDMEAGHAGKAGRFGSDVENARIMAWMINTALAPK